MTSDYEFRMKTALVYDRINKWGGAESVLLALHQIWPDAPLYASVYDQRLAPWADVFEVRTSFLQKLPLPKNAHEYYPFLMGIAFESFNFDEFDVVISVTHEFAKAIITKPKTLHLCYCLTPVSYLWSGYDAYFSSHSPVFRALSAPMVNYLRWYDQIVSQRPDKYVAISKTVQQRIKRYYNRESLVIYPPVNLASQGETLRGEFYLIVSRLVPNKRIDIAIEAFNQLGLPLKIVGVGREERKLKALAKKNIQFLGNLTKDQLSLYYESCLAVVVPGEEDFGIVSVEAQSFGKPVVAFGKGGSTETVVEGETGWFFREQTADSLATLLKNIDLKTISPGKCQENALKFSGERFRQEFERYVQESYAYWQKRQG